MVLSLPTLATLPLPNLPISQMAMTLRHPNPSCANKENESLTLISHCLISFGVIATLAELATYPYLREVDMPSCDIKTRLIMQPSKNLVVNGEFPNNVGNWVVREDLGRVFWEGGRLVLESIDYWARASQVIDVEVGESYLFSGEVDTGTNEGYLQIRDADKQIIQTMSDPKSTHTFTANTSTVEIRLHAGYHKAGRCSFDNISLIKV